MTRSPIDPAKPDTTSYSPAVPISLYRELAQELQTTKAQLDFFKAQNQRLLGQNQRLRQISQTILYSTQNLEQILGAIDGAETIDSLENSFPSTTYRSQQDNQVTNSTVASPAASSSWVTESRLEFDPVSSGTEVDSSSSLGGWKLAVVVTTVILVAFVTGFLVVRPFLDNNNR